MSEIEGTAVEAKADHDAREAELARKTGKLQVVLAACEAVLESSAAREAEVKRLREESKILRDGFTGYRETMRCEMGRLIAEVERLRDAERQRVAEGMSAWCSPPDEQAAKAVEVELMTNAARLIREVIGRDLNRRRRFGMYQDQIDDLWKVVDMLEAAAKAGEEPIK